VSSIYKYIFLGAFLRGEGDGKYFEGYIWLPVLRGEGYFEGHFLVPFQRGGIF